LQETDDECKTAAEIYACSKEKEPAIVDAIFDSSKGNSTVVNISSLIKMKINGDVFIFSTSLLCRASCLLGAAGWKENVPASSTSVQLSLSLKNLANAF